MKQNIAVITVSMVAASTLVNGWGKSLTTVNQAEAISKGTINQKDSLNNLVKVLISSGVDTKVGPNLAPIIGLAKPMSAKAQEIPIDPTVKNPTMRTCYVVLEDHAATDVTITPKPVCAYLAKTKSNDHDRETLYYRVNLNGKLEKAVHVRGKLDDNGKIIRGSGTKVDEDINSPEVKKAFDAEMTYWLKDWLKKQQKVEAKKA